MLGLDLSAPDHTTLSRRAQRLNLPVRRVPTDTGIHLILDSTGLAIVGGGEWAAVKHGGRGPRGWKKLHLGVDGSDVIVAHALTGGHADDATTALDLIDTVEGEVCCLTADAAYDTRGVYESAGARGATVVIPPTVGRHLPRVSRIEEGARVPRRLVESPPHAMPTKIADDFEPVRPRRTLRGEADAIQESAGSHR